MRPASSVAPDGPQNLLDALALVLAPGACGVMVVCAGTVHGAMEVQKVHPYRLDAFGSGDAGPLGFVEEGTLRLTSNWPAAPVNVAQDAIKTIACANCWPRVEIVMNYAGATGAMVDALLMPVSDRCREGLAQQELAPLRGLVVAATGNGTVHAELEAALLRAQEAGVKVVLATRCALGRVLPTSRQAFADSQGLSPVKARVALILALLMAGPP
jgi:L-asparaginase